MNYKISAKNIIGRGGDSFCKSSSKGEVKFFTHCEAKVAFIQYLDLALSKPKEVIVDNWGKRVPYTMIVVKRLSTFEFADPRNFACSLTAGLPQQVIREMELYHSCRISQVHDLTERVMSKFVILRPAMEFMKQYYSADTYICEDMHNENFLIDRRTGEIIPYDAFNFDRMGE